MQCEAAVAAERGSGTIWVLGCAVLVLVAGMVAATLVAVAAAGRRADTAADLAALSAAGRIQDSTAVPCGVARRIAAAHQARMTSCAVLGPVVEVAVEVRPRSLAGGLFLVRATARAGPTVRDDLDEPLALGVRPATGSRTT